LKPFILPFVRGVYSVEISGKEDYLSLAERLKFTAMFPSFLSGTASQSLTFSDKGGGSAIRAIDGNYDQVPGGFSGTHTALGDTDPWWKLDLNVGSLGPAVERVVVWNRSDCCQERLDGAAVDLLAQAGAPLAT
jgi:hypothetical protein